ncbi:xylulose kinase [Drosophila willistoni]|nr:xylulose kinase [Drosophila willistoni]
MILSSITNTASAVVGLRFNKETDVVLSLGPIDKLIMHVENHPKQEEGHLLCDPINPNESFSLICFRNGSRVRDAICEQVAQGSWSTFSEMLKKTPMGNYGNVGLYFPVKETDPPASGTLRWDGKMDPMSHEAIHGCDEFERPEIEARAVIEGQMMHHRAMMKDMDFRFDENTRIIVLGDGSQNESLLQVIADVFNTPVYTHCGVEPALLGGAYRARYAFYEYREANCSCRRCRMASGRNPKLQFEDFFRNMPGALKLMAEPTAGCDVIYDRLTVRCMNMCQLLAASTSIHESHIVME